MSKTTLASYVTLIWLGLAVCVTARADLIDITQPVAGVTYVYPCRFGAVTAATADGAALPVTGADIHLPAGTAHAEISYA